MIEISMLTTNNSAFSFTRRAVEASFSVVSGLSAVGLWPGLSSRSSAVAPAVCASG